MSIRVMTSSPRRWYTLHMEPRTKHVMELVKAVEDADRQLRRLPDIGRQMADNRTQALRKLIGEVGGTAKAARVLGWSPNTTYRVAAGHFARTPSRPTKKGA